ncbi:MAG: SRPBCC domain-containing protein [Acidimicrobiales bacterium]
MTGAGPSTDDDRVFKALADPTRRYLLDTLFARDGRRLSELESQLEMSRFGVMKHLRLLEEVGLVLSRRSGRKELHFLKPVPIRLIRDRWIDKYTEVLVAALSDLEHRLETHMEKVYEIYIRATPEQLWEAITDPEIRSKYNFGARVDSEWKVGSRLEMRAPKAGQLLGEGEVLEVDPPLRLVHTMVALWSDEVRKEGPSRVTWQIEPVSDSCRLLLTHDQLQGANEEVFGGWPMIISGLKTWLETGELLTTPGSLMYR